MTVSRTFEIELEKYSIEGNNKDDSVGSVYEEKGEHCLGVEEQEAQQQHPDPLPL